MGIEKSNTKPLTFNQLRSPKFAMEGYFGDLGVELSAAGGRWGLEANPQFARARDQNFQIFWQK